MVALLLIMISIVSFALHSVNLPVCLQMFSGMLLSLVLEEFNSSVVFLSKFSKLICFTFQFILLH